MTSTKTTHFTGTIMGSYWRFATFVFSVALGGFRIMIIFIMDGGTWKENILTEVSGKE